MKTEVVATRYFKRKLKPLLKRYVSLAQDLLLLRNKLLQNPVLGMSLGKHCYKIRLSVKSKKKGKQGGVRVITSVVVSIVEQAESTQIRLLTIYDKSEIESISDKELSDILSEIEKDSQETIQ